MLIIQTDTPRTEHKETYLRLVAVWNRACAQTEGTYITGKMRARQWRVVNITTITLRIMMNARAESMPGRRSMR